VFKLDLALAVGLQRLPAEALLRGLGLVEQADQVLAGGVPQALRGGRWRGRRAARLAPPADGLLDLADGLLFGAPADVAADAHELVDAVVDVARAHRPRRPPLLRRAPGRGLLGEDLEALAQDVGAV